jgi:hypothetical protein
VSVWRLCARSGSDEQREATPTPVAVNVFKSCVAHPPELGVNVGEAVFGIAT